MTMRGLILIFSTWALASARPETYREKEDFQYSRSSSDDGTKAGFYGAQRGNMGGNYERAHNMDTLAQHQMGSLVTQVDGELGSGADSKSGSVYTAGNSRGVFGSGHYDLSALKGRNFAEGTSYSDSDAQSSGYQGHTYTKNARYNNQQSQSSRQNLGYQTVGTGSYIDTNNQAADNSQYNFDQEYRNQAASNYKFHSQASNQASSLYDQGYVNGNSAIGSNAQIRSMSAIPLKIHIRPGSKATIPLAAETYDASHLSSSHAENSLSSDAELLSNSRTGVTYAPTNKAKHYESSYSYRKEWEKHDTLPIITPTENPFPKNSERYGSDSNLFLQNSNQNTFDVNSVQGEKVSNAYTSGYRANSKLSSAHESRYQNGYNADAQSTASGSLLSANAAGIQMENSGNSNNLIEDLSTKPKSYHSSYSYHKSWERQGDPYVIKPASGDLNDFSSQRLTSASAAYGQQSSHQQGSRYNYAQHAYSQGSNADCDCDENGHIRVSRSYNEKDSQNVADKINFLEQEQSEWGSIENIGQQTQGGWENFEKLGQQSENKWDQLQDLNQQINQGFETQSQNKWDNLDEFGKHNGNLEDLGQQSQNKWDNLETFGQHSENADKLEDLGQQSQNNWDNLEAIGQHAVNKAKLEDLGQQSQNKWNDLETLGQHLVGKGDLEGLGQESENKWDKLDSFSQHAADQEQLEDLGQKTQNGWNHLETFNQKSQNNFEDNNMEQQTQNGWDNLSQQEHFNRKFETVSNQHTQSILEQQDHNGNNIITDKQLPHQQDQESTLHKYQNIPNTLQNIHNHLQNQNFWSLDDHHSENQDTRTIEQVTVKNDEIKNFWDQFDQATADQEAESDVPKNTQEESSINGLWGKLGQVSSNSEENSSYTSTTTDSNNFLTQYINNNIWKSEQSPTHNDLSNFESTQLSHTGQHVNNNKKDDNLSDNKKIVSNTEFENSQVTNYNIHPNNIGRGDIESEDTSAETSLDLNGDYKSVEAESLSLNNFINKEEAKFENKVINVTASHKYGPTITTLIQQKQDTEQNIQKQQHNFDSKEIFENIQQVNVKEKQDDFNQQYQNIDTQTLIDFDQHEQMQENVAEFLLENLNQFNSYNPKYKQQKLDTLEDENGFQKAPKVEEQQVQDKLLSEINMQQFKNSNDQLDEIVTEKNVKSQRQGIGSSDSGLKNQDEVVTPVEVVTEKTSFWKTVGGKFTNAKDSVVSWFRGS